MTREEQTLLVPMRFAGVDLLVEARPLKVVGSQPTSAAGRIVDAYEQAEEAIVSIARSFAGTIAKLADQAARPSQITAEIGLSVSVEGDIMIAKGTVGANIAITLTYDVNA